MFAWFRKTPLTKINVNDLGSAAPTIENDFFNQLIVGMYNQKAFYDSKLELIRTEAAAVIQQKELIVDKERDVNLTSHVLDQKKETLIEKEKLLETKEAELDIEMTFLHGLKADMLKKKESLEASINLLSLDNGENSKLISENLQLHEKINNLENAFNTLESRFGVKTDELKESVASCSQLKEELFVTKGTLEEQVDVFNSFVVGFVKPVTQKFCPEGEFKFELSLTDLKAHLSDFFTLITKDAKTESVINSVLTSTGVDLEILQDLQGALNSLDESSTGVKTDATASVSTVSLKK